MKLYVVGATGVVGRQFLKILEEENFDIDKIEVISSFKSEGTKIQYKDKYLITKSKSIIISNIEKTQIEFSKNTKDNKAAF